ncbi:MAG: NAD-dependent epimerase/dehydratase family protein, partial [Candidatus Omnitrophota bacterium]
VQKVDIKNKKEVFDLLNYSRPDVVYHLAARVAIRIDNIEDKEEIYHVNAGGTLNILQGLNRLRQNVQLIFGSTTRVYDTKYLRSQERVSEDFRVAPYFDYEASKIIAEQLIMANKNNRVKSIILRMVNITPAIQYDAADVYPCDIVAKFAVNILRGQKIVLCQNAPQTMINFIHVDDAVDILSQMAFLQNGDLRILNLGLGESISIVKLLEILETTLGKAAKKEMLEVVGYKDNVCGQAIFDNQKLKEVIQFPHVQLTSSLEKAALTIEKAVRGNDSSLDALPLKPSTNTTATDDLARTNEDKDSSSAIVSSASSSLIRKVALAIIFISFLAGSVFAQDTISYNGTWELFSDQETSVFGCRKDFALGLKPENILVDENKDVFVADSFHHCIVKCDPEAKACVLFAGNEDGAPGKGMGEFSCPQGIVFDKAGNMLVADTKNNRILIYDLAAKEWKHFAGNRDCTSGKGIGEFYWPVAIAVDDNGDIYVFEEGNRRVQKCNMNKASGRKGTASSGMWMLMLSSLGLLKTKKDEKKTSSSSSLIRKVEIIPAADKANSPIGSSQDLPSLPTMDRPFMTSIPFAPVLPSVFMPFMLAAGVVPGAKLALTALAIFGIIVLLRKWFTLKISASNNVNKNLLFTEPVSTFFRGGKTVLTSALLLDQKISSPATPLSLQVQSLKRQGIVLGIDGINESYIFNAGVLPLDGQVFFFARRALCEAMPGVRRSEIGLYVQENNTSLPKPVDIKMFNLNYSDILPFGAEVIALEDPRVIERDGRIYVYMTVVEKKGENGYRYYSAMTTHDTKEFLAIVYQKFSEKNSQAAWRWTPLAKVITDGYWAEQSGKNFVPFGNPLGNGKWHALYRPEENNSGTIRLLVSSQGLTGPWQDAGLYMSAAPGTWMGASTYVAELPQYEIVLIHVAREVAGKGVKIYDLHFLFVDKNDPRHYQEIDSTLQPEEGEPFELHGWIPGALYCCGAVLTSQSEEQLAFDIYYSGSDTVVKRATVTLKNHGDLVNSSPLAGKKILVVDDDLLLSWPISTYLQSLGYRCATAKSAQAARAIIEASEKDPFDLVISDVNMPGFDETDRNLGGISLAQWLKTRSIPIISMSSFPEDYRQVLEAAGVVAVLGKPIVEERLLATIQKIFDRQTGPRDSVNNQESSSVSSSEILFSEEQAKRDTILKIADQLQKKMAKRI